MRILAALLVLLLPTSAQAISEETAGWWLGAAGSGVAVAPPFAPGPGWQLSAGTWWGTYDHAYSLGRFTGLGVTVRQDLVGEALRTAPTLELRRGTDVLVVGVHAFAAAGPLLVGSEIGATGGLGGGLKWRFRPSMGLNLRLELGADHLAGQTAGRAGLSLGFELARPFRSREVSDPGPAVQAPALAPTLVLR